MTNGFDVVTPPQSHASQGIQRISITFQFSTEHHLYHLAINIIQQDIISSNKSDVQLLACQLTQHPKRIVIVIFHERSEPTDL